MSNKHYYIYMMTNYKETTLYTGVTNSLERRIWEHKNKATKGFTEKYNVNKLVYFEEYTDIEQAILREKQIKKWSRKRKNDLVNKLNKDWLDLYVDIR